MAATQDIRMVPSPLGGGWSIPVTPAGIEFLENFFGCDPDPLPPLGGDVGYIVDPHDIDDLAECLQASDVLWSPVA